MSSGNSAAHCFINQIKNMKKIFILIIFSLSTGSIMAQDAAKPDTLWKLGAYFGVNFNQVGLTNWAAGGENSFSVAGIFSGTANYKKGNITWDNSLDLGYGLLKCLLHN